MALCGVRRGADGSYLSGKLEGLEKREAGVRRVWYVREKGKQW